MARLAVDFKLALRAVGRSRFVSVLAILAFALGIGVTTAVFSIFSGVLLAPLPYAAPDRLVAAYDTQPACSTCPASVGVYGVMAYNVRRQRREFGIRLALGADRARVRNLIVGRGAWLAAAGVAIGAVAAWLLTGVLQTMLNDVKPRDPVIFVATAMGVLGVATLASYLPARAAGRVDPMVVLRDE